MYATLIALEPVTSQQ